MYQNHLREPRCICEDPVHVRWWCLGMLQQRDSYCLDLFVYNTSSISPMHCKSKQPAQKAFDEGIVPSVYKTGTAIIHGLQVLFPSTITTD